MGRPLIDKFEHVPTFTIQFTAQEGGFMSTNLRCLVVGHSFVWTCVYVHHAFDFSSHSVCSHDAVKEGGSVLTDLRDAGQTIVID